MSIQRLTEMAAHAKKNNYLSIPGLTPEIAEAVLGEIETIKDFTGKLWERLNRRRCYLIERKHKDRASDAECLELEELQALADENIRIFATLPIAEMEAYLEKIEARAALKEGSEK